MASITLSTTTLSGNRTITEADEFAKITAIVDEAPQGTPLVLELSNGQTITIAVGETTGSVTYELRADDAYTQGASREPIFIDGASGGNYDDLDYISAITIVNTVDDKDETKITLSADSLNLVEGQSTTITASVNNAPKDTPLVIELSNGQTITIAVGQTTGTVTYEAREDDSYAQGKETDILTIESAVGGKYEALDTTSTVAINTFDDSGDISTITLRVDTSNIIEGQIVTITASVDNAPQGTPLVLELSNGQTITIAVGETTGSVTYESRADDVYKQGLLREPIYVDEANGGNYEDLDYTSAVTIVNTRDDADITTVTIEKGSSYSVSSETNDLGVVSYVVPKEPEVIEDNRPSPKITLSCSQTEIPEGVSGVVTLTAVATVDVVPTSNIMVILTNGQRVTIPAGETSVSFDYNLDVEYRGDNLYNEGNYVVGILGIVRVIGGGIGTIDSSSTININITDDIDPVTVDMDVTVDDSGMAIVFIETSIVPDPEMTRKVSNDPDWVYTVPTATISINGTEHIVSLDINGKGIFTFDTKDFGKDVTVKVIDVNGNYEAVDLSNAQVSITKPDTTIIQTSNVPDPNGPWDYVTTFPTAVVEVTLNGETETIIVNLDRDGKGILEGVNPNAGIKVIEVNGNFEDVNIINPINIDITTNIDYETTVNYQTNDLGVVSYVVPKEPEVIEDNRPSPKITLSSSQTEIPEGISGAVPVTVVATVDVVPTSNITVFLSNGERIIIPAGETSVSFDYNLNINIRTDNTYIEENYRVGAIGISRVVGGGIGTIDSSSTININITDDIDPVTVDMDVTVDDSGMAIVFIETSSVPDPTMTRNVSNDPDWVYTVPTATISVNGIEYVVNLNENGEGIFTFDTKDFGKDVTVKVIDVNGNYEAVDLSNAQVSIENEVSNIDYNIHIDNVPQGDYDYINIFPTITIVNNGEEQIINLDEDGNAIYTTDSDDGISITKINGENIDNLEAPINITLNDNPFDNTIQSAEVFNPLSTSIDFSNLTDEVINDGIVDLKNGEFDNLMISLEDIMNLESGNKNISITGDEFDNVTFKDTVSDNGTVNSWSKVEGTGADTGYDIYTNSGDDYLQVKVEQPISDGITH